MEPTKANAYGLNLLAADAGLGNDNLSWGGCKVGYRLFIIQKEKKAVNFSFHYESIRSFVPFGISLDSSTIIVLFPGTGSFSR